MAAKQNIDEKLNEVNEALAAITSRLDRLENRIAQKDEDSDEAERAEEDPKYSGFTIPGKFEGGFVLSSNKEINSAVHRLLDLLANNEQVFFEEHAWAVDGEDASEESEEIRLSSLIREIINETNSDAETDTYYRVFDTSEDMGRDDDLCFAVCKTESEHWFEV